MSEPTAFSGARIFDGSRWHDDSALVARDGTVEAIVATHELPAGTARHERAGGLIAPGFVDLQVNGGGSVMLNDRPDLETIRIICRAHVPFGTTALLPTLITDTPAATAAALAAGEAAWQAKEPGFLGLHLEGPHLSVARKGAHDPALIRPITDADEASLITARRSLPALLVTIAPESVDPARIRRLVAAGVVVSVGHSDAGRTAVTAAADAGATLITHLFNAMSQIGNREPGVAGAALDEGRLHAGLIADGIHVDPATIGIALRAKRPPGHVFLVTDAMATIGTELTEFTLNGRRIKREAGSLRLEDGTLAGADLDMISAVRFIHGLGLPLEEALRMASLYPAAALGVASRYGHLGAGAGADFVCLGEGLSVDAVWIGGSRAF